jgi:ABC-type multidrug transport system ATPase subunit
LSLTLAEGQTFGFAGPDAAGKTSAMRIVLGRLPPNAEISVVADYCAPLNP